jgi:hypothetical protein
MACTIFIYLALPDSIRQQKTKIGSDLVHKMTMAKYAHMFVALSILVLCASVQAQGM